MIKALSTAATGMEAQQANIDRISNDLANVNTDGYKRSRVEFQDLMYQTIKRPGEALGAASNSPVGTQVGMGVKVDSIHKIQEQGPTRMTYNPFDLMIEGENAYFPVEARDGRIAYTRNGAFKKDSNGVLTLTNGARLIPQITVPSNALDIKINNAGEVKAIMPNQEEAILGQIQVIRFTNPEGLSHEGNSMAFATPASGAPQQGMPGEDGFGFLQQGALEGSNVNVANSMVDMITTQRGFEANAKALKAVDDMLNATINLR